MKEKKLILTATILFLVFGSPLGASNQGEHLFYVPHVVSYPEFYPANHGYTVLWVIAAQDGTNFEIDQDGDGIYEGQFTGLAAGSYETFYRTNWPSPGGTLSTGASVRSAKPLQLLLNFGINHHGTFDHGALYESLLPVNKWGDTFIIPVGSTYLYLFTVSESVVNITPPGQPSITQTIPGGSNIKLSNITPGTHIEADKNIYSLAVNCQPNQDYPWMYNVLPVSQLGNNYYHDSTYGEVDLSWPWPTNPKIVITAINDGTTVYIDENHDEIPEYTYIANAGESINYTNPVQGAHIWANYAIYVVNVENWSQAYKGHYGGAASEYIPTSSYGTEYALADVLEWREIPENNPRIFVVASENDTTVELDFGWDGIDVSTTLNKGDVWPLLWPDYIANTAHVMSSKGVQVIYRTDLSHPHHPGVNCAYTAIPLSEEKSVEAVVDIDPDTLNRKSKGKWMTAYIELPDGFNVGDIDINTVAITAVDEVTLAEPLYAELKPTSIGDYDSDGIPDLMVKFDRQNLINALTTGNRLITLSGELTDGNTFQGSDTIKVIH